MKIYVPPHLRDIKIVDQMCKMIEEYNSTDESGNYVYFKPESDPFSDYQNSLSSDLVKRFVDLCISSNFPDTPNLKDVVNYVTRIFYSTRGTLRIFDYMTDYLGLEFKNDFTYTVKVLRFSLLPSPVTSSLLFDQYLRDFLGKLLYYQNIDIDLGKVTITLISNLENKAAPSLTSYKRFSADEFNS